MPLVISFPNHVPSGLVVDQPVSNASLPATIMALLGKDKNVFKEPSLVPLWTSKPESWPFPHSDGPQNCRAVQYGQVAEYAMDVTDDWILVI